MNEVVDGTAITAEVARELTRSFIARIEGPLAKLVSKSILLHLKGFEPYLAKTYRRCNAVRVLANRDHVYELEKIYVAPTYLCGDRRLSDKDIATCVRDGGRLVVQGFGGVGKTVLLKHIWLSLFAAPEGKVPVFVELRKLNDIKNVDLASYISTTISTVDAPLSVMDFKTLLDAGRFTLIFDGFDELSDDKRDAIELELIKISTDYPKVGVLVSSRRDDRFVSWGQFSILSSQRYSKEEIHQIVSRVDFEKSVKKKFLKEIIENNFEKYEDFLSTPLLALMMLLTYRQFADIPEKIHIFYRYAYQTLFSLHDASKEAFKRKRKTNLDEDEFARLFSVFCLMSYIEYDINFDKNKAIDYIDRAKKRTSIKVDSVKFLDECVESVNLLYKDGDLYSFVHRSFQEYFSAHSIVSVFSGDVRKLVKGISFRPGDTILQMAYEMNTDLVESSYFVEEYESVRGDVEALLAFGVNCDRALNISAINWAFIYSANAELKERLLFSVMAPAHPMWDLMRKMQMCFSSLASDELNAFENVVPTKELKALTLSVKDRVRDPGDRPGVVVAMTISPNGAKNLVVNGNQVEIERISDLVCLENKILIDHIEQHVVTWRASAVFLTKKMKEMLKRERSRKITLDDIL